MKVLVTGASGRVAPSVIRVLQKYYDLRLLDLVRFDQLAYHDWAIGSVLDQNFLHNALEYVGAIVHFATPKNADSGRSGAEGRSVTTEQLFDANVKGLYQLLEVCKKRRIKRFVHVSSATTVIGHWHAGKKITVDSPYSTDDQYSLTKMLQEQICQHVVRNSNMTIVALRPWMLCDGLSVTSESGQEVLRPYHPGLIDSKDFAEACHLAIKNEDLKQFQVFHTVATQEARKRFDAKRTKKILGFEAKQDFKVLWRA